MEEIMTYILANLFGGIFYGLTMKDFAVPLGLAMWSPVLFIKLKNVDYTDVATGSLYATFCTFSGLMVVILCPMKFHQITDYKTWIFWSIVFFALGASRWSKHAFAQMKDAKQIGKKAQDENEET